jgi:DNA polymerase III alpha subunit
MQTNKFGQIVLDQDDLFDLIMQGQDISVMPCVTVHESVNVQHLIQQVPNADSLLTWQSAGQDDLTVQQFDRDCQSKWHMPQQYQELDIAEHVISLCQTQVQLQRVAQELLLFQDRNLFDLLRYLKYLVDTMRANNVIWGVGRGSSVSSYVLYLLGVHQVDSVFYDLDIQEFLR